MPTTPVATPQQSDPYAEFGGSVATAPASPATSSDPYAEFGGSVTTPTPAAPPVGPNGQPNPNNVYAAAPEENTPEGAAKALAARQAAHPIISGVGLGAESLLQPFFHPIDTVENLVKSSIPGYELPSQIKKSYGLIQQYETSRSQGKSIWQSIGDASALAAKQDAAHQQLEQAIAEYKRNPTETAVKYITQLSGNLAMLLAGGQGATMEAEAPAAVAETEAPAAREAVENQATHVYDAESGTIKPTGVIGKAKNYAKEVIQGEKVAQPGAQTAVREGAQASVESSNTAAAARAATPAPAPAAPVPENVNIPPEYQDLVNDAMNEPPQWTPETAKPIADELGKDFEVRGSVGEGKPTNNDLDIWQSAKDGELTDAAETLKKHGFERVDSTPHGETWTNTKTGQNIDLWKHEVEPKAGFGADTDTELTEEPTPRANTSRQSAAIDKEGALLQGKKSIIDDHLSTLEANEKAAYQELDKTAGFDLKAEKQALSNDKYKLSQLGNTDTDITQRGNLIESINDSTGRIVKAEADLKAAGIDPSLPDQIHKQRMAGGDFRKSLVKNTNPDGSVNIKGLWKDARNLRNSKYGDRLEQFFGSKEAADEYQAKLAAMDKLGASALTKQRLAKLVAGYLAYKVGGHLFGMATNAAINTVP